MATLDSKQILHLPVVTKLGRSLGKIAGFEVDVSTQTIVRYTVASGSFVKPFSKTLLINANQVISIDQEKMVVEDSVIEEPALAKEGAASPAA